MREKDFFVTNQFEMDITNIFDETTFSELCLKLRHKMSSGWYYRVENNKLIVCRLNKYIPEKSVDIDGVEFRNCIIGNLESKMDSCECVELEKDDIYILSQNNTPIITTIRILEISNLPQNIKEYLEFDKELKTGLEEKNIDKIVFYFFGDLYTYKVNNDSTIKFLSNVDNYFINGKLDFYILAAIVENVYKTKTENIYHLRGINYLELYEKYKPNYYILSYNDFHQYSVKEFREKLKIFKKMDIKQRTKLFQQISISSNTNIMYHGIHYPGSTSMKNIHVISKSQTVYPFYISNKSLLFLNYLIM